MSIIWFSSRNTQQILSPRILTWSGVRSWRKILQKRLKRRHILPSAQETEKESSLGQRVKNYGNGWLTSTKTQIWPEEKTLWGRVLVVPAVSWDRKCWTTLSIKELRRKTCCGHCSGWTKLTGWFGNLLEPKTPWTHQDHAILLPQGIIH